MQSCFVECCGREIHYTEWGADAATPDKPILIMWHGLTRCARDFDIPAAHFSDAYRVVCPDTLGRGLSQWAEDVEEYSVASYAKHAGEFVNKVCGPTVKVDWLGTSMGGLIAWNACTKGGPLDGRIRRLLLNDIGPELNPEALQVIAKYSGTPTVVEKFSQFAAFVRGVYEPLVGPQPGDWFTTIAMHTCRRLPDGRLTTHYDPRCTKFIGDGAKAVSATDEPWREFDGCTAGEILSVRGGKSNLFLPEAHEKMLGRGLPRVRLETVPDVGHAPTFNNPSELAIADSFFRAPATASAAAAASPSS